MFFVKFLTCIAKQYQVSLKSCRF